MSFYQNGKKCLTVEQKRVGFVVVNVSKKNLAISVHLIRDSVLRSFNGIELRIGDKVKMRIGSDMWEIQSICGDLVEVRSMVTASTETRHRLNLIKLGRV